MAEQPAGDTWVVDHRHLARLDLARPEASHRLLAGAPADSLIVKMIRGADGKRMPPKGDALTAEQIETIEKQRAAILDLCMDTKRLEATPVHEFVDLMARN